jgi:hypothetical protein
VSMFALLQQRALAFQQLGASDTAASVVS